MTNDALSSFVIFSLRFALCTLHFFIQYSSERHNICHAFDSRLHDFFRKWEKRIKIRGDFETKIIYTFEIFIRSGARPILRNSSIQKIVSPKNETKTAHLKFFGIIGHVHDTRTQKTAPRKNSRKLRTVHMTAEMYIF